MSWGEAYAKVARAEYLKGELPAVFLPALLTATSFGELLSVNVLESIVVFSLLYVTGFLMNAVTDREADLRYSSFKRAIGTAATRLGDRAILALIAAQVAVGLLLTVDLASRLGNPWLVPLVLLGVFLGLAYSAAPFSFKTRGVAAHALALALSAFTVPFLFLYLAANGTVDLPGALLIGAFTLTGYSLEYANQAYDFTEDLASGAATPAVRLGLRRSLLGAFGVFAASLPLLAFALAHLALSRPAVAYGAGEAGKALVALAAVAAVAAGFYPALRGMARISASARSERSDSPALVQRVQDECDYAFWQSAGVSGIAAFGLVLFAVSAAYAPSLAAAALDSFSLEAHASDPDGVAGQVSASAGAVPLPQEGALRIELEAPPGSAPYASLTLPVRLPPAGSSAPFDVPGLPLLAGVSTTAHITLLVDADFDGHPESGADEVRVDLGAFP